MEEMNSSLKGLCDLIADQGAEYAHQHTEIFLEIIRGTTDKEISREQIDETFKIFAFLNWALVSRIWSYMKNTTLRKDLKGQIYKIIFRQKTRYEWLEVNSIEGVAFFVSSLDKELGKLPLSHTAGMEEIVGLSARPTPIK